jgi:hypothetical protein
MQQQQQPQQENVKPVPIEVFEAFEKLASKRINLIKDNIDLGFIT